MPPVQANLVAHLHLPVGAARAQWVVSKEPLGSVGDVQPLFPVAHLLPVLGHGQVGVGCVWVQAEVGCVWVKAEVGCVWVQSRVTQLTEERPMR